MRSDDKHDHMLVWITKVDVADGRSEIGLSGPDTRIELNNCSFRFLYLSDF